MRARKRVEPVVCCTVLVPRTISPVENVFPGLRPPPPTDRVRPPFDDGRGVRFRRPRWPARAIVVVVFVTTTMLLLLCILLYADVHTRRISRRRHCSVVVVVVYGRRH